MAPQKTIAVIDDKRDILELASLHLKKVGFHVDTFSNGEDFFHYLDRAKPDLVVLDLMLPDIDGLEICKSLKKIYESMPLMTRFSGSFSPT